MILIVGGPNHSGTSMVTKTIIDLYGFDPGEYSQETSKVLPYIQYENSKFKDFCKQVLTEKDIFTGLFDYKEGSFECFKEYVFSLDNNKDYIFKYPKSVFIWDFIDELLAVKNSIRVKYIYTQREIVACCKSIMQKSNIEFPSALAYYSASWRKAIEFSGNVFFIDFDRMKKCKDIENLSTFLGRFNNFF